MEEKSCLKKHTGNYSSKMKIPGSFLGFLKGTNFAPIAKAMGGSNIKP
jgi:hypothetical protein